MFTLIFHRDKSFVYFGRDKIIETLIKLVKYVDLFGDYSYELNQDAYRKADRFARNLFVWRKPTPKFRRKAVRINNRIKYN